MSEPTSIFELVDLTDEETYFPLGIFLTLETAIAAVDGDKEPWTLSEQSDYADRAAFEIRERKVGTVEWSNNGHTVWAATWVRDYGVEEGEEAWRRLP